MRESIVKEKLKKLIVFNTPESRQLIESMISDEAAVTGKTASSLIEEHILGDLLPRDDHGREYIRLLYATADTGVSGETGTHTGINIPVGNNSSNGTMAVCQRIFDDNSAGQEWDSCYDNLLPLVRFCANRCLMTNHAVNGAEPGLAHFSDKLKSICSYLDRTADQMIRLTAYDRRFRDIKKKAEELTEIPTQDDEKNTAEDMAQILKSEANYGMELVKTAQDVPTRMKLSDYYRFIIDNWFYLKNRAITYRFLSDLVRLDGEWTDTPASRTELVDIIRDLSKEWG